MAPRSTSPKRLTTTLVTIDKVVSPSTYAAVRNCLHAERGTSTSTDDPRAATSWWNALAIGYRHHFVVGVGFAVLAGLAWLSVDHVALASSSTDLAFTRKTTAYQAKEALAVAATCWALLDLALTFGYATAANAQMRYLHAKDDPAAPATPSTGPA